MPQSEEGQTRPFADELTLDIGHWTIVRLTIMGTAGRLLAV